MSFGDRASLIGRTSLATNDDHLGADIGKRVLGCQGKETRFEKGRKRRSSASVTAIALTASSPSPLQPLSPTRHRYCLCATPSLLSILPAKDDDCELRGEREVNRRELAQSFTG
ncbi:unnamed protein product [Linum trigynum]|uniref:Uncharacterized protein n=1 Tax=Linum trigynum TaxID=586398 RepID=A0AAV2DAE1_9ROSI